ncbi:hypothetical protein [Nitrosomonas aestuarii]|uniref:hypothetical protein n=2 Tax=Nitrosomonas aestuarii TaxID=52441 RepID=UPI00147C484B|nr:hypothetical protein [Nitrosomonas aestuarii]
MKFIMLRRAVARNDSNLGKTEKDTNVSVFALVLAGGAPSKTILFVNFINEVNLLIKKGWLAWGGSGWLAKMPWSKEKGPTPTATK